MKLKCLHRPSVFIWEMKSKHFHTSSQSKVNLIQWTQRSTVSCLMSRCGPFPQEQKDRNTCHTPTHDPEYTFHGQHTPFQWTWKTPPEWTHALIWNVKDVMVINSALKHEVLLWSSSSLSHQRTYVSVQLSKLSDGLSPVNQKCLFGSWSFRA